MTGTTTSSSHPDFLKYKILQTQHPDYTEYIDTWETISILREGAPAIERYPHKFLKQLPGEPDEQYKYRLDNIAFTPVFTQATKEFVAALVSQPLHVTFNESEEEFWIKFRNSIDGSGQDEIAFISSLFSQFLLFGRCWVLVNRDRQGEIETRLDETNSGSVPFAQVVPCEKVINWGDEMEYAITYEISPERKLFEKPIYIASWGVWTASEYSRYEAEIELDRDGEIHRIKNHLGKWVFPSDEELCTIARVDNYPLELTQTPLVMWEVIPELWSGKNSYLKQIQHTKIESAWTQSGAVAGQIQRVLTPYSAPVDDPRILTEDPEDIETGTNQVLIGSDFKIVETTGQAVDTLTDQLETISTQIKDITSMGYLTRTSGANESGKAKLIDMTLMVNNIKTFGKIICQTYEQILILVAEYMGYSDEISVQGLDTFEVDELSEMVIDTKTLMEFENRIAPIALKKWFTRMSILMAGSVSQEVKNDIVAQMENDQELVDEKMVIGLKNAYGLNDAQVNYVTSN